MKKLISIILFLSILLTLFPAIPVFAETSGIFTYTVSNNQATITRCECDDYSDIEIPETLSGYPVTAIEDNTFLACRYITGITIPKTVLTIGDSVFLDCDVLKSISVHTDNPNFTSVDGILFDKNKTKIICYPRKISNDNYTVPTSILTIGNNAFSRNTYLDNITITKNVSSIGDDAFSQCRNLTFHVDAENQYYASMDNVLFDKNITTLIIGPTLSGEYTVPSSVTTINKNALADCPELKSLIIPKSVRSIGETAFGGCENLTSIQVDAENEYYQTIEDVLFNKRKSELICYPSMKEDLKYNAPDGVITIKQFAFNHCCYLNELNLPNSIVTIEDEAFSFCTRLYNITMPESLKSIGVVAFLFCENLGRITIPNGVTTIEEWAFMDCDSLETVIIPESVTSIGEDAFYHHSSWLTFYVYAGSYAQTYAEENYISYQLIESPQDVVIVNPTNRYGWEITGDNLQYIDEVVVQVQLLREGLENAKLFVAFYDDQNKLISIVPYDGLIQNKQICIPIDSVPTGAVKMKILCWDGYNTMNNLMIPYEI